MSIAIRNGEYITELSLKITNPTGASGIGLGGTVNLSGFANLTGITASGNGITQLISVSDVPLVQTLRFENNNLTKQNLENIVTDIYANKNTVTGASDKTINLCLTGAQMGTIDRIIRLNNVNRYEAELDKLNFSVFYSVNGETDQRWIGSGTVNNFSNTGNWANRASPLDYDALYFWGTTRLNGFNDLQANTQFNGITFNSGAGSFNLSGNRFVLTFGGINNNSTNTQTVHNDIVLSGNNRTINCTSGDINLLGNISGSGPLVKNGVHTLSLSGNNSYTGNTFINAGTVNIFNSNPFGTGIVYCSNNPTSSPLISIAPTATPTNTIINNPIFINGNGTNLRAWKSATFNGLITFGPNDGTNRLNIRNNETMTINGGIFALPTGLNVITMEGSGTFFINSPIIFNTTGTSNQLEMRDKSVTVVLSSTGNRFNILRCYDSTVRTDVSFAINNEVVTIGGVNNNPTDRAVLNLNGTNQIIRNFRSHTRSLIENMQTSIFNNTQTGSNLLINQLSDFTYVGTISGNINLIKSGTATLITSGNMASGVGLIYTGSTTVTGGILSVRTPFSDPFGKITSGVFSSGPSLTVGFAVSPVSNESFRLLSGRTVNNYSIITLRGAAAGRTATYNSSNSTLTLTN